MLKLNHQIQTAPARLAVISKTVCLTEQIAFKTIDKSFTNIIKRDAIIKNSPIDARIWHPLYV